MTIKSHKQSETASAVAVGSSAVLGAFVQSIKPLASRCNDLLRLWWSQVNAKMTQEHSGQTAGNNVRARIAANRNNSTIRKNLAKVIYVIADSQENLELGLALIGLRIPLLKPRRHESANLNICWPRASTLECLRKLGVWI